MCSICVEYFFSRLKDAMIIKHSSQVPGLEPLDLTDCLYIQTVQCSVHIHEVTVDFMAQSFNCLYIYNP